MSKRIKPTMSWALDEAHLNEHLKRYWEQEAQEAKGLLRAVVSSSSIQMVGPSLCEKIEDFLDESEKNNSPTK